MSNPSNPYWTFVWLFTVHVKCFTQYFMAKTDLRTVRTEDCIRQMIKITHAVDCLGISFLFPTVEMASMEMEMAAFWWVVIRLIHALKKGECMYGHSSNCPSQTPVKNTKASFCTSCQSCSYSSYIARKRFFKTQKNLAEYLLIGILKYILLNMTW